MLLFLYAGRMAAFEAIERLQKFDWLIQKLHSLRTSLQSEPGLAELQQLHALQLLQRNAGFNGSSLGESEEEEKMELCKLEGEEEDIVDTEEEEDEDISEDQSLPLALTTTISETNASLEQHSNSPGRAHSPIISAANDNDNLESLDKIDNELEEQSEEREEDRMVEREEISPPGVPPATYPRFPTSHLFPPLPFDNLLPLIGDESELKVGESSEKYSQPKLEDKALSNLTGKVKEILGLFVEKRIVCKFGKSLLPAALAGDQGRLVTRPPTRSVTDR